MTIGQGTKHYRVYNAEDRSGCADAQSDDEKNDSGEAGHGAQCPSFMLEIGDENGAMLIRPVLHQVKPGPALALTVTLLPGT